MLIIQTVIVAIHADILADRMHVAERDMNTKAVPSSEKPSPQYPMLMTRFFPSLGSERQHARFVERKMNHSLSQWLKVNRNGSRSIEQKSGDRPTVMVVEDEFWIRVLIADELRTAGYLVVECSTADEAIDLLRCGVAVHVVFTDVNMPGSMNGVALAQAVRVEFPELKLLVTSAHPHQKTFSGLFVPKPYDPHRVTGLIDQLIGTTPGPLR